MSVVTILIFMNLYIISCLCRTPTKIYPNIVNILPEGNAWVKPNFTGNIGVCYLCVLWSRFGFPLYFLFIAFYVKVKIELGEI